MTSPRAESTAELAEHDGDHSPFTARPTTGGHDAADTAARTPAARRAARRP